MCSNNLTITIISYALLLSLCSLGCLRDSPKQDNKIHSNEPVFRLMPDKSVTLKATKVFVENGVKVSMPKEPEKTVIAKLLLPQVIERPAIKVDAHVEKVIWANAETLFGEGAAGEYVYLVWTTISKPPDEIEVSIKTSEGEDIVVLNAEDVTDDIGGIYSNFSSLNDSEDLGNIKKTFSRPSLFFTFSSSGEQRSEWIMPTEPASSYEEHRYDKNGGFLGKVIGEEDHVDASAS